MTKETYYPPPQKIKYPPENRREGLNFSSLVCACVKGGERSDLVENEKTSELLISDKAVKQEMNRLKKIFKKHYREIDENGKSHNSDKGELIERLISEAAFVRCVLLEAQRLIKSQGLETTTVNASQKFRKAIPAVTIYSDYMRTYTSVINTLISYIPEKSERKQSRLEALMLGS